MKYACVTTMSPEGYEQYGKTMLESYVKHWDIPIWVYYEGKTPPELVHEEGRVHWMPLDADKDRAKFIKKHTKREAKTNDYRLQIVRFSHKIFALTDPQRIETVETDNWIWLDADTETFETVDEAFLDSVCPAGFCGSYLGRTDWHHSECGFVSYNRNYGGIAFLEELRKVYTSGKILDYDEHHDSFIFDQIRKGWWYNISEGVSGMNVFDACDLGQKMKHYKGPLRKKGKDLSNTPVGYATSDELSPNDTMSQAKKEKLLKEVGSVGNVGKDQLIVKTKNCVDDKNISANIHYFATLIDDYVVECSMNNDTIVFCSGGPSLEGYLEEIKALSRKKCHYVVCVKHAHDPLIEYGIIPWACILLDPRGHVLDFIENPHSKVRYLAASMVHPTTVDRLLEKGVHVWGYHAHVGAQELEVVSSRFPKKEGNKHFVLGGGCSTAMRGLSVLHCMGFRNFKLYGYDLCYTKDDPDVDWEKLDKHGQKKYMEVTVHGRTFITDAEKVAQGQDFAKIMQEKSIKLEVFGNGMVPHIWNSTRKILPNFKDVFK
jgi:hypothetical protein